MTPEEREVWADTHESEQYRKRRQIPTAEGRTRYPPTGYYDPEAYEREYPCTCAPTCPASCAGECGCPACRAWYVDSSD